MQTSQRATKRIALSLILFAVTFNAVFLLPEFLIASPTVNDEVLHISSITDAVSALKAGQNPTDFWFSEIGLGYPFFHSYQHLAQVALAIIAWIIPSIPFLWIFNASRWLLMVFFPLSVFFAMRRMDFDWLESAGAGFFSSLLSTAGLMGIEFGSYVWQGTGLFTQLVAMTILPLAIAETYRFLRGRSGLFLPVLLGSATLLSQVIYGYVLFLSLATVVFLNPTPRIVISRLTRFFGITLAIGAVCAYFLIPLWQDRAFIYHSVFEPSFKYDSFGVAGVLSKLYTGKLFDYHRLPILTAFLLLSIVFLIARKQYKKENCRFLLVTCLLWLFLFFGRPFWGGLLDLLPGSAFLHFHRFLGAFQLFSVMIIGAGLGSWFRPMLNTENNTSSSFKLKVSCIVLVIALMPVFRERVSFYGDNARLKIQNRQAFLAFAPELSAIKDEIMRRGPGRVFAGLPGSFGDFPYYKVGDIPLYALFPQIGLDSFGYAYHAEALTTDLRLNFNDAKPEQYSLFNIRYVILHNSWTPPRFYTLIKRFNTYSIFEAPTTGYFDLVSTPAIFYGDKKDVYPATLAWLASGLPQSGQYPILNLEETPTSTLDLPTFPLSRTNQALLSQFSQPGIPIGHIKSETVGFGEYSSKFSLSREGYLLLKINFYPWWHVMLDGHPVDLVMLSPGFIGIKATPGLHEAIFQYQPPASKNWLLILGTIVLVGILIVDRKDVVRKTLQIERRI